MEILFNMTIAGTITALMILIIKGLLKDKLNPKWHCILWIILAVRLLIPGLPESDFSLWNTIPTAQSITTVEKSDGNIQIAGSEPEKQNYIEGSLARKVPVTGSQQSADFSITKSKVDAVVFIWIAGMILMAGFLAGSYLVFYRRTRQMPVCKDPELLSLLERCKLEAGIYSERIIMRFGSNTPMLQGFFRPAILIPEGYEKEELRHVILHELCHYKHKDVIINIICCIYLCVYWFNPVFWLCFFMIRRDLEILCDERAIDITGERKEYATVLLKTALKKNQFLFATTSMQNGEKEVERRIRHIAYFKKPKIWISAIAIALAVLIVAVCLTNASFKETINLETGGGYFFQIPKDWVNHPGRDAIREGLFYNEDGENFGGISMMTADPGTDKKPDLEDLINLIPNHSEVLMSMSFVDEKPFPYILVNLNMDSETAAQTAERNAKGDNSPSKRINQNYIFFWPDHNLNYAYSIWANSDEVTDQELIKIAKTFRKDPYPQGYQPEIQYQEDWDTTADHLLKAYFENYVDTEMSIYSDISGYRIDQMEQLDESKAAWNTIYSGIAVYRVDYTLDIAYPDYYSFPGGGFEIGEGNKTKIYKNELAVFQKDWKNDVKFLGFVWPQDRGELGDSQAILHTVWMRTLEDRAKALLEKQTPYIGDASKVGGVISNLPLAQLSTGMELHTKEEPYGLTVNYDLSKANGNVFESRKGAALTDSRGWELVPELRAQMMQNSAILFSLIDNCSYINLNITGISEFGAPYTYSYQMDRENFNQIIAADIEQSRKSGKKYSEFMTLVEQTSLDQIAQGLR